MHVWSILKLVAGGSFWSQVNAMLCRHAHKTMRDGHGLSARSVAYLDNKKKRSISHVREDRWIQSSPWQDNKFVIVCKKYVNERFRVSIKEKSQGKKKEALSLKEIRNWDLGNKDIYATHINFVFAFFPHLFEGLPRKWK